MISGCWNIRIFIFWGHLSLENVFHWRSPYLILFYFGLVPWAYVQYLRRIRSVAAEIFKFSYFGAIFHWMLSSIEGRLHWNLFWLWFGPMSLCLKFEEDPISGLRYSNFHFWGHLPLEFIFLWRSSSLKPYLTLVWSHVLLFKIWGRSDQCLLRYSNFHILRSSSIRGRLPLKFVFNETFSDFGLISWADV